MAEGFSLESLRLELLPHRHHGRLVLLAQVHQDGVVGRFQLDSDPLCALHSLLAPYARFNLELLGVLGLYLVVLCLERGLDLALVREPGLAHE